MATWCPSLKILKMNWNLVGGIGEIWRFRIAKFVPFWHPRWLPIWEALGQHGDSELLNQFVTISMMAATATVWKLFSWQLMPRSVDQGPSLIHMSVSNFSHFCTPPHNCSRVLWFHVGRPLVCLSIRFWFPDDNLSKHQWIFTKLGMCIDIVETWFGIANGQISSIFDGVICLTRPYFRFRTITWVNNKGFSPNLLYALTLRRSGLGLLKGKCRQIFMELSARDTPIFSFPDDNLSK